MIGVAALVLSLGFGPAHALEPVSLPLPPLATFPDQEPPDLDSLAWALYSIDEGAMLWTGNPDQARAPASITKVMTALVVIDRALPDEVVVVSQTAADAPIGFPGQPELEVGEEWTIEELLAFLLVKSGNDSAVALAEAAAGSEEAFAELMNERAAELGMSASHFVNPNGLDDTGHLSTARDLIRLGVAALREPRLVALTRVQATTFRPGTRVVPVNNTNKLLGTFPGILGLKTGDTSAAGLVLLSYVHTAHEEFVGVVMGADDHLGATADLMAYAARTLGLKDHFYSVLADHEAAAAFPEWLRNRFAAAGPLADPSAAPSSPYTTPGEATVLQMLRVVLPRVLGGDG